MGYAILSLVAALAAASPAVANEGRIEARGGVYWTPGATKGTAGIAAGYDFDLGSSSFAGVEVSGDKILTSGTRIAAGFTGRLGIKPSPQDKLYAAAGYTTKPCTLCEDALHAGAGYEHNFGSNLYGKAEYRHYFVRNNLRDSNAVVAGLGVKF